MYGPPRSLGRTAVRVAYHKELELKIRETHIQVRHDCERADDDENDCERTDDEFVCVS